MNHSKKIISISILSLICITAKVSAIGAGVQLGGTPGLFINENGAKLEQFTGRLTGTFRLSRLPMSLGFGFKAGKLQSDFSYGLYGFADYYAIDTHIKNTWSFYSGFGAEASLVTTNFQNWNTSAGLRLFAGMDWLFIDNFLEVYVQQNIVPTIVKNLNNPSSKASFMICIHIETGIRMHF